MILSGHHPGSHKYPDMHRHPQLFKDNGYFNSKSITFNLRRFREIKCSGQEIIKATIQGPRRNNLPQLVALRWLKLLHSMSDVQLKYLTVLLAQTGMMWQIHSNWGLFICRKMWLWAFGWLAGHSKMQFWLHHKKRWTFSSQLCYLGPCCTWPCSDVVLTDHCQVCRLPLASYVIYNMGCQWEPINLTVIG